jgi:Zn-dependent M16 (insulinase) family peptidase
MEALIMELAGKGILGVVTAISLFIAYKKDKQVEALYDRLIEKSSKTAEKYHTLASELHETLRDLHASIEDEDRN